MANASHELRTPLARQRTLAQVALADPDATKESLRATHERVLASGREQERLIDALLTLARGQAGLDTYESFDLADLTGDVLLAHQPIAPDGAGLEINAQLRPAPVNGDRRLVVQLINNLVDNSIRHNKPGGWISLCSNTRSGVGVLSITNSGPTIPPDEVDRLFEPFHRLGADRINHASGHGLGLSIVQAITNAHNATLTAQAQPGGGLDIEIAFPLAFSTHQRGRGGNSQSGLATRMAATSSRSR